MSARALPDVPAQPEHSTDATGVQTGNSDLSGVPEWRPWAGPAERPTLPGHEHQLDPAAKAWPCLSERRTDIACLVLAAIGISLRVGGVS